MHLQGTRRIPGRKVRKATAEASAVVRPAQQIRYDIRHRIPEASFLDRSDGLLRLQAYEDLLDGELMLEKTFVNGPLAAASRSIFDFDREHYPRFCDGPSVRKFCVPIRPDYHRRLFPEIAFGAELPLFPATTFAPMLAHGSVSTPGNTIRKVYLCRAKITRMR